jgi:polar amino acid transport system substrate-binding protein
MKKWYFFIAMFAVVVFLFGCAGPQQPSSMQTAGTSPVLDRVLSRSELRVGMSGDMPPFTMTTKEDKIIGLDADLAAIIADAMDVRLDIRKIKFKELLPALEAGHIDMIISNMTMTPERNLKVIFLGPYFTSGKGLLTKLDLLTKAVQMEDLNNSRFTFVTLQGSTSEEVVRAGAPKASQITAGTIDDAVQMVVDGKADAMIADYPICVVTAYRHPGAGLVPVTAPITYEPIGIALPKGDPHLANWLGNFLHGLEKAGYMKRLRKKWFDRPAWIDQLKGD